MRKFRRTHSAPRRNGRAAFESLEGRRLLAASVYEAEAAEVSGASVSKAYGTFTGAGFVDYRSAAGEFVEWTVNVPSAGTHTLEIRYANASSSARPLELMVDG